MECVLIVGLPGSGKSTFYKTRFSDSHMRINLDMLRTRAREDIFLAASLQAKQSFVVDNTNPSREDRRKYIELGRKFGFKLTGYFMEPDLAGCLKRNADREGKHRVPDAAIRSVFRKLEPPAYSEGFDELYRVTIEGGQFITRVMSQLNI